MRYFYALLLLSGSSMVDAQVFAPVNSTSTVGFQIKNFGSTVDGTFKGLKGQVIFDASNLSSAQFDVTIETTTVDTGIGLRDKHLHKEDYFDVANYPTIRFVSTKIEKSDASNEGVVTGRLTIKDTTREISFPFNYEKENGNWRLNGQFEMNRRDFDVGGSSFSLADELMVILDVWVSPKQ